MVYLSVIFIWLTWMYSIASNLYRWTIFWLCRLRHGFCYGILESILNSASWALDPCFFSKYPLLVRLHFQHLEAGCIQNDVKKCFVVSIKKYKYQLYLKIKLKNPVKDEFVSSVKTVPSWNARLSWCLEERRDMLVAERGTWYSAGF